MTTADWKQIEEMGISREQFTNQAMNYNNSSQAVLDLQFQNELDDLIGLATDLLNTTSGRYRADTLLNKIP
jgi:hypothetical protein